MNTMTNDEYVVKPLVGKEYLYTYCNSHQISTQTGLIGYIRADMGTNGDEFHSIWNGFRDDLHTSDFNKEMVRLIRSFTNEGGFLSNRDELKKFCLNEENTFRFETGRDFGVRINTLDYAYLMRLNPNKNEYNLYCFCYQKDWLNSHIERAKQGIRFIDSRYKDLFKIEDGDKIMIVSETEQNEPVTCRYIDEYHFEYERSLFHICEFAEKVERANKWVIPIRSSLPEQCYVYVAPDNKIGIINKGEQGFVDSKAGVSDPSENKRIVNELNDKLGVTPTQRAAMRSGALFGWDKPYANPQNYNEKGEYVKSKNRDYER